MQEVTREYIDQSIEKAKELYDKAVKKAKLNGTVSVTWIQQQMRVNWYGAAYIVRRMEDEGLCGPWQRNGYRVMN